MPPRDIESLMWDQALAMLARVERLQRRFFEPGPGGGARPAWEPPVDVYETEEAVWIVAALPGVPPERVQVEAEPGAVVIRGERRLPADARTAVIRRLEIPYGRFERRIEIGSGLVPDRHELLHGCLYLRLRKRG
ncbi:MAG TPA: Hsp20/alpha crystallin family protein [Chromatiales bacterium]|nr:Hsp20/alpha crystallin family protein [Chromatiales bacterium]